MTDQRILEKLFKKHYRRMYRLATILLHDDAESKDVVHDIFAHLLNDNVRLREETAESFLLTSVRNRCLNVIRNRQIQERVEHLYLLDLDTSIMPTERMEEELEALRQGIDQLEPPVCRDIIVQHFRDGITFKEIADGLKVSETTVYKHLRRALSQLRKTMNCQL
jgi:RNA polymerase sigma-70 factor (ECF subfamily)